MNASVEQFKRARLFMDENKQGAPIDLQPNFEIDNSSYEVGLNPTANKINHTSSNNISLNEGDNLSNRDITSISDQSTIQHTIDNSSPSVNNVDNTDISNLNAPIKSVTSIVSNDQDDINLRGRRVVASLTTMPDRYFKIIKTLECLNKQTYKLDAIYLSLPERSRRLNVPYPPVPPEITKLCTVVRCADYGPITKIVGGLLMEDDPDTVIITFDDDMMYPPDLVAALLSYHEDYPNSALGSSGMLLKYNCPLCAITPNENNFFYRIPKFQIVEEGRRVDSIYGYPGALYIRRFFPSKDRLEIDFLHYALIDHDTFMNDDIIISGYLSLRNIERRIFPNMPIVSFVVSETTGERIRASNEISYDLDKFFQRMNAAITKCKSLGMYVNTEPMDVSESIVGVCIVIIICVIVLIALIVHVINSPKYFNLPPYLYL
ncbi:Hypothetical protein HVR_LOCUS776 [uncultured virus]|nr:Hypothetical protein HVR_LOCUS776 [uncultured virus]